MKERIRERLIGDLTRLTDARPPLGDLIDEAENHIRRAIPHLGACWHTMDPATLIETRFRTVDLPSHGAEIAEYEYTRPDFNKFADLARGPRHAGVLSEATGGDLLRSARYRDYFLEHGIRGELRASLVIGGACWGSFVLFREAPADFTADECEAAHRVATILGLGFRTATVLAMAIDPAPADGPGLVILDGHRRIESLTPAARSWLDELTFPGEPVFDGLPHVLLTVAESARSTGRDATARVPGTSGGWTLLHASPVSGASDPDGTTGRVAVILQGAAAPTIAPLIAAAYGLTARERELTELVLRGYPTTEIATRLFISPHTVQEHLKSIFAKAGVRSRRELTGQVFQRHYRPRIEPVLPAGRR